MKEFLLMGLIVAASTAALASTELAPAPSPRPAAVASKFQAVGLRPEINCGFICDSFGRCRRVCW